MRITDIQDGKVNWDTVPFTQTNEPEKYLLYKNDIVFARTGATVGKSFLIKKLPYESVYASYLIRIRLKGNISPDYVYHFFNSQCYWEQITGKSVGVGQPNCNGTSLKELFIPLPPIAEQSQIILAPNNLLKYVKQISNDKDSLLKLINSAKSKVLDLAIRGRLVPQNSNDEPASVLLECIRAEKEVLIKQGKIKKYAKIKRLILHPHANLLESSVDFSKKCYIDGHAKKPASNLVISDFFIVRTFFDKLFD